MLSMNDWDDSVKYTAPTAYAARDLGDAARNGSPKAKRKLRILRSIILIVIALNIILVFMHSRSDDPVRVDPFSVSPAAE